MEALYGDDALPGPSYLDDAQPGPSHVDDAQPGPSYVDDAQPGPSGVQRPPRTGISIRSRGRGFQPATRPQPKIEVTAGGARFQRGESFKTREQYKRCQQKLLAKIQQERADEIRPYDELRDRPAGEPSDDVVHYNTGIVTGENFYKYDDLKIHIIGHDAPIPIQTFEEAGLCTPVITVIQRCKYARPTPIQKMVIPVLLENRDLMACAQTGSGKTAAYLIPIISHLCDVERPVDTSDYCKPQALIVSPTRELAHQIFREAKKFASRTSLKVFAAYGGTSVNRDLAKLANGCDILVGTPGRLLDILARHTVSFRQTKFFVIDEADKMLDQGFMPAIDQILRHGSVMSPSQRCVSMFSATYPPLVQKTAREYLHKPLTLAVGTIGSACSDIEQRFVLVSKFGKRPMLIDVLRETGTPGSLVFVGRKRITDFIATYLCEKEITATSIHGDRDQASREEALEDFRSGRMDVLVATSVAARGLDIQNVFRVINYDLPVTIEEYIHRIGRTGRLGNRGVAVSLFDPEDDYKLAADLINVLEDVKQEVPDFIREAAQSRGITRVLRDMTSVLRHREEDPVPEESVFNYPEAEEFW